NPVGVISTRRLRGGLHRHANCQSSQSPPQLEGSLAKSGLGSVYNCDLPSAGRELRSNDRRRAGPAWGQPCRIDPRELKADPRETPTRGGVWDSDLQAVEHELDRLAEAYAREADEAGRQGLSLSANRQAYFAALHTALAANVG